MLTLPRRHLYVPNCIELRLLSELDRRLVGDTKTLLRLNKLPHVDFLGHWCLITDLLQEIGVFLLFGLDLKVFVSLINVFVCTSSAEAELFGFDSILIIQLLQVD